MTLLYALDALVLKRFQAFSEEQQVHHNRTCYDLAYICFSVWAYAIMFVGGSVTATYIVFGLDDGLMTGGLFFATGFIVLRFFMPLKRRWYSGVLKLPEFPVWIRLMWSVLMIVSLSVFAVAVVMLSSYGSIILPMQLALLGLSVYAVAIWAEKYFGSCTPLPPEVLDARRQLAAKPVPKIGGLQPA